MESAGEIGWRWAWFTVRRTWKLVAENKDGNARMKREIESKLTPRTRHRKRRKGKKGRSPGKRLVMSTRVSFRIGCWWSGRFLRHGASIQKPRRADLFRAVTWGGWESYRAPEIRSTFNGIGDFSIRLSFLVVAADKSRETKRSISIGSTVAILGRGTSRPRVSIHGIENWETLRGRVRWKTGSLPGEEKEKPVSPRPITDYSVVFATLSGVLRRRESAISFPEIRRDFFMRISCFFRSVDIYFSFSFEGNIYYFSINMIIIPWIEWNNDQKQQ